MLVNYRDISEKNILETSLTDALGGKFYLILNFMRISELLNHMYQGRKFIIEYQISIKFQNIKFVSNFVMTRIESNVDFIEKCDILEPIIVKIIPKTYFRV